LKKERNEFNDKIITHEFEIKRLQQHVLDYHLKMKEYSNKIAEMGSKLVPIEDLANKSTEFLFLDESKHKEDVLELLGITLNKFNRSLNNYVFNQSNKFNFNMNDTNEHKNDPKLDTIDLEHTLKELQSRNRHLHGDIES